jgi:hypothetical protein
MQRERGKQSQKATRDAVGAHGIAAGPARKRGQTALIRANRCVETHGVEKRRALFDP